MTAGFGHEGRNPYALDDYYDYMEHQQLEKNVSEILRHLAPTLIHLQIAGDFVRFETLASIKWPRLRTLKLGNHLLSGGIVPLPVVVSQMPHLCSLALNFRADSKRYTPVAFCFGVGGATLCAVLPNLEALSISNCHPNDSVIAQLPQGLRSLRVCALRDHPDFLDQYHSVPLNEVQAYRWIEAASKLACLVELALTLEKPQSQELLQLIANACPLLQKLELEQDRFENNNNDENPMQYESFVKPLQSLTNLRHLRLTIEIGPHNRRGRRGPRPAGNEHRFPVVCRFFAERLLCLKTIGLLYHNAMGRPGRSVRLGIRDRSSVWYTATIHRDIEGKVPSVAFWKFA
ncbi:hypothetical protein E4T56_gene5331 [Termitomyces sp. T112]|nr:hypothetical protein E4T56_gene5331 [Termitomyces sp. T112]